MYVFGSGHNLSRVSERYLQIDTYRYRYTHTHIDTDRYIQRDIYTMFRAMLFTEAKRWEEPKCPSAGGRINTVWSTHTMGYIFQC